MKLDRKNYTSPAKINFFLDILGKRGDGYHNIVTWMQSIDLCDKIIISRSPLDYSTLRTQESDDMPFGKRNLCIKAYDAVRDGTEMDPSDTIEITLDKKIPLGSGLGGGSSNAASVINGMNEVFELGLSYEKKLDIAAKVGSDVPFFISGGAALARGRGEILEPMPPFPAPLWIVIAKPDFSVSTGDAYKWIKNDATSKEIKSSEIISKTLSGDTQFLVDTMYNAFEQVVFEKHPYLAALKNKLKEAGCIKAQMTGSGSGIFGVCEDEQTAGKVVENLAAEQLQFLAACKTF